MLRRIAIRNVRMLEDVEMEFPEDPSLRWHVVLGDNGTGKTTLVRAVAMALVGPQELGALRVPSNAWIGDATRPPLQLLPSRPEVVVTRYFDVLVALEGVDAKLRCMDVLRSSTRSGHSISGFSSGFGAVRRFRGGAGESAGDLADYPAAARHFSVFAPDVDFRAPLAWLQQLHVLELEKRRSPDLLRGVVRFLNESGLPNGVRLSRVLSDAFEFTDETGATFGLDELADGYRSVLAVALELLHQLHRFLGHDDLFEERDGRLVVAHPGLVLIDEVDAHLHPSWQATIGEWFLDQFPHFDFLVTTHSPLVCRAAVRGTVWRIQSRRREGPQVQQITGDQLDRLLYGDLNQALESEAFQLPGVSRSERARDKLDELARLNRKQRRGQLAPEERTQLQALQSLFPDQVRPVE